MGMNSTTAVKEKNIITYSLNRRNIFIDINTFTIVDKDSNAVIPRFPDEFYRRCNIRGYASVIEYDFFNNILFLEHITDNKNDKIKIAKFIDKLFAVGLRCDALTSLMENFSKVENISLTNELVSYLKQFHESDFSYSNLRNFKYMKYQVKYNVPMEYYRHLIGILEDIEDEQYFEYCCLLVGFRNIIAVDGWNNCIIKYYRYNQEMNGQWATSKHFYDDFCKLEKEYTLFKEAKRNEILKNKKNDKLMFEYGDYITVYPTSVEQFKDEGEQQKNCVFRLYLDSFIDGDCEIVFIRNKNDITKSVVTCEINPHSLNIQQFLLRFNDSDIPDDLREFKIAYQNYLNGRNISGDDDDDEVYEVEDDDDDDEVNEDDD